MVWERHTQGVLFYSTMPRFLLTTTMQTVAVGLKGCSTDVSARRGQLGAGRLLLLLLQGRPSVLTDHFNLTPLNVTAKKRVPEQARSRMDRLEAPGRPGCGTICSEGRAPDTDARRRDNQSSRGRFFRFGTRERLRTGGDAEGEGKRQRNTRRM